jgi:cysteine-rich repeat protein
LSSQTNCGGGSCDNVIGNLTITTPLSGTVTSGTSIVVSGTYAGGVQSITVNGTLATLSGNTYTATVALNTGTNVITVIATPADADCKTETQLTTVIRTTGVCPAPLALTIASPNNNASTRNAQIAVSGTISDTGAVVKVAGEQVVVTASGTYQATVELVLGTNTILVTAGTGDCAVSKTVNVVRTTGGGGGSGGGGSNYCGDGRLRNSEQCDDGNNRNGDGCDSNCKLEDAVCGNGRKESGEQCDDGNKRNGDDCSATCKIEVTTAIKKKKIITIIGDRKPLPVPLDLPVVLPKTGELARVVQVTRVAQTTQGGAQ